MNRVKLRREYRVETNNWSSEEVAAHVAEALNGRYEVLERLGKGAFGEVYKAHDTLLNRVVAVKRIRMDQLTDSDHADELRARFLREAQVSAQLQHPGIVAVYDIISLQDTSYIIMEFVEGKTLAQTLASKKKASLIGSRPPAFPDRRCPPLRASAEGRAPRRQARQYSRHARGRC